MMARALPPLTGYSNFLPQARQVRALAGSDLFHVREFN